MRFLMIVAALPLAACGSMAADERSGDAIAPSGSGTARSFAVSDFTKVELAGADDVDVTIGAAFSVRADGPADELDKLDIRKDGSTLTVDRKRNLAGWSTGKTVKIHVTMPAIQSASVAGSGNLEVDRVEAKVFEGNLAGSGDLTIGRLVATTVDFNIAGSGSIDARGQVDTLKIAIAGSGDVDAPALKAGTAEISIAGSGSAAAEVDGKATISILGSGDVTLGGKPRCETSKMGSGEVRCG